MQRAILIAEKPSYMRKIKACYDKHEADIPYEIDFMAQAGHAVQLLSPNQLDEAYSKWDENLLPIEPEEFGGFKYKVIPGSEDIVKKAKAAVTSGDYDYVIHAGDPDQEGELLTRLLLNHVKNKLPVLRFWPNDETDAKLLYALKNMQPDDDEMYENLYHAALVRQHADWRFGMNGSRAIAARFNTKEKTAAGRVMTAVQAMVVNRENEINNFKEKVTYGVKVSFEEGYDGQLFKQLSVVDEKTGEEKEVEQLVYFDEKSEAEDKADKIASSGQVVSIIQKTETKNAPKLYALADAQIDASAKLGFPAEKTLATIQSLYERKLITYPRTDCNVLSSGEDFTGMFDAVENVPGMEDATEEARLSLSKVIKMSKYVNDKELQKHGHSALVPTTEAPDLDSLSDDERDMYLLICRRFLAIFQPPLVEKKTKIVTKCGDDTFVTNGKVTVDPGFTEFLGISVEENELPSLSEGQNISVKGSEIVTKKTTPPKRFTEGTIIQAMEHPGKYLFDKSVEDGIDDFHIGTPATRGSILEKLKKDSYIKSKGGTLHPTDWSMFLIEKMKNIDITKVDMTGKWEHLLDNVRNGEVSVEQAEDVMRREVKKMVTDILKMESYSFGDVSANREIVGTCPRCGKNILMSEKSFYCSGWKEGCISQVSRKYFTTMKSRITPEEAMELINGGTIKKMLTFKSGNKFEKTLQLEETTDEDGKKKLSIAFVKQEENTNWDCPHCHEHKLKRDGIMLRCECGYNLWTAPCHRQLSEDELDYIFNNGHTKGAVKGLVSSKGSKFDAKLILSVSKDDELKGAFDLEFANNNKKSFKKKK